MVFDLLCIGKCCTDCDRGLDMLADGERNAEGEISVLDGLGDRKAEADGDVLRNGVHDLDIGKEGTFDVLGISACDEEDADFAGVSPNPSISSASVPPSKGRMSSFVPHLVFPKSLISIKWSTFPSLRTDSPPTSIRQHLQRAERRS